MIAKSRSTGAARITIGPAGIVLANGPEGRGRRDGPAQPDGLAGQPPPG